MCVSMTFTGNAYLLQLTDPRLRFPSQITHKPPSAIGRKRRRAAHRQQEYGNWEGENQN